MFMPCCYRRTLAICALLACAALGASPAHAASRAASGSAHSMSIAHRLADEMLGLLNADRARAGRDALTVDGRLAEIATSHSRDMAVRHYFAHTAPGDSSAFDRFARTGIQYSDAGENIGRAGGRALAWEVAAINATMMAEPLNGASHHDVIVDPALRHVGIGISIGPGNMLYVTEDFTD